MLSKFAAIGFALVLATAAVGAPPAPTAAGRPPDISGIWGAAFVQSLSEKPPFLPQGLQRFNTTKPEDDPLGKCMPPGIPRLMNLLFPFEVIQTPKIVYFLMEYGQHVRRIYIDAKQPDNPDPTWHGYSTGHWEGRTLVVDTIGFNEDTWLDMRGHPHSDALHITERYTLSEDGKSLKQEVTIDDPKMYSKPWQSVPSTHPKMPSTTHIEEYICVPG